MEKGLEFCNMWVNSQKEFFETWLQTQKEFLTNWTESIKKLQESFLSMSGSQDAPYKEMVGLYNSWFNTMVDSAKVFSEETAKIQENWKATFEKQMEMSREIAKNFSQIFEQGGQKK